jgi:rod shape-determining protein MreC
VWRVFSFLRRHRDRLLVSALLLGPLLMFLSVGHKGRESNLVDRGVLALASPVQQGLQWSLDGAAASISGYLALRGAHEEAQACRGALSMSRAELNALKEAALENERLKRLLAYSETTIDAEIPARVIGINPSAQFFSVRINRGEADGVRLGSPVLTPDGVVGQVVRIAGGSADVMLMSDPASRIAVTVQRSRVRGTALGVGGSAPLALDNVARTDDLVDGDTLVTSGTDGIFPTGLVVGHAESTTRGVSGLFLKARVQPAVDFRKVEEVLVLPPGNASFNQAWLNKAVLP